MYVITKDRVAVCYTSEIRYVIQSTSKTFYPCEESDATHVVAGGTTYRIRSEENINEPTYRVSTANVGKAITENQQGLASLDKMTVDQEYRITLLELGVQ